MANGHIWRLRKAVYGLKQAARSWHACLRDALSRLGYLPSAVDPALSFVILRPAAGPSSPMWMPLVDAGSTAGTGPPGEIDKDFAAILEQFEGRHLGEIDGQIFLGILHSTHSRQDGQDHCAESACADFLISRPSWLRICSQGLNPYGSQAIAVP
jgi:hypothetical protein